MELNIDEALRYLGVKSDPDGVLHAQMIPLAAALQRGVRPRSTWVLTDKVALALP